MAQGGQVFCFGRLKANGKILNGLGRCRERRLRQVFLSRWPPEWSAPRDALTCTRLLQKVLLQERLSAAIRACKALVSTGVLLQDLTRSSPAVNS